MYTDSLTVGTRQSATQLSTPCLNKKIVKIFSWSNFHHFW